MDALKFHLTIHNPFRPVEGLIIDVKTKAVGSDVDSWRPQIEKFIDSVFLTNAILIYSPSQIALAAVIHSASSNGVRPIFKNITSEFIMHLAFTGQCGRVCNRTVV